MLSNGVWQHQANIKPTSTMSPQEYKQHLKSLLFDALNPGQSDEEKLRRIDAFRRMKGVKAHIRRI